MLRVLLIAGMAAPTAIFLATPGTNTAISYAYRLVAWLIGLVIVTFLISAVLKSTLRDRLRTLPGALPAVVLAVITVIIIAVEACRAGALMRFSVATTADFRGFRFYGVGNEYMGVWLGMMLISIIWIRECFPGWEKRASGRIILFLACFAFILGIGLPYFGANAGGVMAAVVGLGLVYLSGTRHKFGARHAILFVFAAVASVVCISLIDLATATHGPTHIGMAANTVGNGGLAFIAATAIRKITMNLGLMATTQSKVAMVAGIPFFWLWFSSVGKKLDHLSAGRPAFRSGLAAVVAASIAAFIFNDSGIVAGFMIFGFAVMAVLYSMLDGQASAESRVQGAE
jgi:MFS family permease